MKKSALPAIAKIAFLLTLMAIAALRVDAGLLAGFWSSKILLGMLLIQPVIWLSIAAIALRYAALVGPDTAFAPALRAVLLSTGLNAMLPGRIAEILKATYLRDHANVALSAGMSAIFLERMADLIFLALFAALGMQLLLADSGGIAVAVVMAVVAIAGLMVLIKFSSLWMRSVEKLPWPPARTFISNCLTHISARADRGLLFKCLLYTLLTWAMSYLSVLLFIGFTGTHPIGFTGALMVFVAATVGGAIPLMPAGLGTYEAAVIFVLQKYGYGLEEALVIAFTLHLAYLLPNIIAALVIAGMEKTGMLSLIRQIRETFAAK